MAFVLVMIFKMPILGILKFVTRYNHMAFACELTMKRFITSEMGNLE